MGTFENCRKHETTNGAMYGHKATGKNRLVGKQSEIGFRVIVFEVLVQNPNQVLKMETQEGEACG